MPTYPLAKLSATIDETGISIPTYVDVLESLKASFRAIFGDDIYVEADSQDGQLLAIIAQAIHDCNQTSVAVYNAYSPQTAVGVGLSSAVKINHLTRLTPTKSTVEVLLTGTVGTTINGGIVGDANNQRWFLPSVVTIPIAGVITVTATAENEGTVTAGIGDVFRILTPVAGWQAVTNIAAASPGLPIESDAELRKRQEISPALNAYTVITALVAAIKALPGVVYGTCYENDTDSSDANGLPPHSIALVVKGGDVQAIAETIFAKKAPGVQTHGTTTTTVTDASGGAQTVKFFVPAEQACKVGITLQAESNYNSAIAASIKQSVVDYINGLSINEDLVVNRLYAPALLYGAPESNTYKITAVTAALLANTLGTTDVAMTFTQKATCTVANVTITVV